MKEKTVCFSGHRPEKLPDKGSLSSQPVKTLRSLLQSEIDSAVNDGYTEFIVGMARGIDLWAGEMVTDMICRNNIYRLTAVFPYRGYEKCYKGYELWVSNRILSHCSEIIYLNEQYYRGCMKERNEYMVDHSSRLIAVVDNMRSGTGQTIRYAKSQGLETHILDIKKLFPQTDPDQTDLFDTKWFSQDILY
ncbi:MAG: DUF1273 family protein [Oscillospiraceae bacterium]|nr:DUF1273 family protein [Oscillospiraceae bacterium]